MDIGYARVSTLQQNLEGQTSLLTMCEKIFQEKMSGVRDDRPELLKLLEFVREGDTVYVTSLDRLARNAQHLQDIIKELDRKKVGLTIIDMGIDTKTPMGKMMVAVFGAMAEFDRQRMLERQAIGIAAAKAKGKYKGRKPKARAKSKEVLELLEQGMSKAAISAKLSIGITSIYRIVRANKETPDA